MTRDQVALAELTETQCEIARVWRNEVQVGLRTPYLLTPAMQADFYATVVANRNAPHRYWALEHRVRNAVWVFAGMAGLTDIQWENGLAEISLLIDPARRRQGLGSAAVGLILEEAFDRLRLQTVCGESYEINPAVDYIRKIVSRYRADLTVLPRRKFWNGQLHDSLYFTISVDRWRDACAERRKDDTHESADVAVSPV